MLAHDAGVGALVGPEEEGAQGGGGRGRREGWTEQWLHHDRSRVDHVHNCTKCFVSTVRFVVVEERVCLAKGGPKKPGHENGRT